jgi:hypothetical protein
MFLGDVLVSWSSKHHPTVSRSSAEVEYRTVANAAAECIWLRQLLGELHFPILKAIVAFCDNVSAVYMSKNPVHHKRMKHIELDIHFVREREQAGELRVLHVLTGEQYADIVTKGLTTKTFEAFRGSLCVMPMIHHTAGVIKCICIAFIIALDEVFPVLLLPTTLSRSCARSVDAPRALAVPLPCKLYKYLKST